MPARKKTDKELDSEVLDLVREQASNAMERAKADPRRISATWVATGESLALLICNATSAKSPTKHIYRCRVLDCIVESD
jgi:hypothetical protein